jgi:hypothetical protein
MNTTPSVLITEAEHRWTDEERHIFLALRSNIRHKLTALENEIRIIKTNRFHVTPRGHRMGLYELRGQVSALLCTYRRLKGYPQVDAEWYNEHTEASFCKWIKVYGAMYPAT